MEVSRKIDSDVVVIGGGNAGLVAAIAAKENRANVLIIEKSPKKVRGGNSRYSDAQFRIPIERGLEDFEALVDDMIIPKDQLRIEPYSKDAFYNDIIRISDGLAERYLAETIVNNSIDVVKWMKKHGIKWEILTVNMAKEGEVFVLPAGQIALQAWNSGEGLAEMLYEIAENQGIDIVYETAARKLIMNSEGKICGVVVFDKDGITQIDCKNVILACGGFQGNVAWRRKYLGENWDLVKLRGTRYSTGEGIQMAEEIGAQTTGHWGGCHASVVSEDSPMVEAAATASMRYSYPFSVMVNRYGKRFFDEGEDLLFYTYAKCGREILHQPNSVAFQIYDSKVFPYLYPEYHDVERVESDSLEELAEDLDINVQQFLATIKEYNQAINDDIPFVPNGLDGRRTNGLNPDKSNWANKIDTPPFRGYAVVCGITMSYGGLKTNEKAQVLNTSDLPIKGLYAVGELAGGLFYHNYPGGTGLIKGAVMGKIAGTEAASRLK